MNYPDPLHAHAYVDMWQLRGKSFPSDMIRLSCSLLKSVRSFSKAVPTCMWRRGQCRGLNKKGDSGGKYRFRSGFYFEIHDAIKGIIGVLKFYG